MDRHHPDLHLTMEGRKRVLRNHRQKCHADYRYEAGLLSAEVVQMLQGYKYPRKHGGCKTGDLALSDGRRGGCL